MASSSSSSPPPLTFPISEVAKFNQPLGPGKFVKTAGCIIIGDEVLNGKTKDTNSNYFAQFCFQRGIDLKRIEVISDDEEEIAEAVVRFAQKYDWTITSGGIGPTFDDITYASIARAFGELPLEYDLETIRRMEEMHKRRIQQSSSSNSGGTSSASVLEQTEEMIQARKRMALFPSSSSSSHPGNNNQNNNDNNVRVEVIHPSPSLWVPIVRVQGKICILPGVPRLFEGLLDAFEPYVPIDTSRPRPHRLLVHTKRPESSIAPYLERLNSVCKSEGIRLGSYPKFQGGVDVSLIGEDLERLMQLAREVERELEGRILLRDAGGE